jgi:signal transduction histidine kinase
MVALAVVTSLVQSYFELNRLKENTNSLILEQIDLTVKKLDRFTVYDQNSFILKTIYHLKKVDGINMFDSSCQIIKRMPINFKTDWNCKGELPNNIVIYKANNVMSETSGATKYILAKVNFDSFKFFQFENFKVTFISLVLIFLMTVVLNFLIKKKVSVPLKKLNKLIGQSGILRQDGEESSKIPEELMPIYENVLARDEVIQRHKSELIKQNEIEIKNQISQQVAHDIRSPIMVLRDYHLKRLDRKKLEGAEADKDIYIDALNDLEDLTKQLFEQSFDYSNDVILSNIVKDVVEMKKVEFSNEKKQVNISLNGALEENHKVQINPTKFKFILSNIINNAKEASRANKACQIYIQLFNKSDHVIIEIADNGKGLKKSQVEKIFERGVSINKPGGSGLGLADAKKYIEKVNGSIAFNSTYRRGAAVTIKLPIVEAKFQFNGSKPFKHVLIEDYRLGQLLWLEEAENKDLDFAVFSSPTEFENNIDLIDKEAQIYLDSHFPDFSSKGEDWAEGVFERGFKNIYFCSNSKIDLDTKPWIKGIAHKHSPFCQN